MPSHDLAWLMQNLAERVLGARSVLLLSSDGMVKAAHGLERDDAEQLAAVASGLFSLACGAGRRFANGGSARQVVVELSSALLFVTAAGDGACLALLTDTGADPSLAGYEMGMLVKQVRQHLATPARHL